MNVHQKKSDWNATVCNSCNPSSFYRLASIEDIDISNMIDRHHITSHPSSSDSTSFEENMFLIENTTFLIFFPKSHWHRALI